MLNALLVGILVGFVLAIPPGPIGVAVVKQGVERKFRGGAELAAGAAAMDSLYALAAAFASSTIMSAIGERVRQRPWAALTFQIVCVVVLVIMGIHYLRAARTSTDSERMMMVESKREARARRLGFKHPFLIGIVVAVTNVASPTFLPSLIFLTGFLGTTGWLDADAASRVLFAIGFGIGTLGWFLALLRALYAMNDKLTPRVSARVQKFAGGAFILFAAILAAKVIAAKG
jgi:threonine/homoserine/homoserine lactone efflux protein